MTLAVVALGVLLTVGCMIPDSRQPARSQALAGSVVTDRDTSAQRHLQRTVLAISVDGLRPTAVPRLGEVGTPTLHGLPPRGHHPERPDRGRGHATLPTHTSMITGRPVA